MTGSEELGGTDERGGTDDTTLTAGDIVALNGQAVARAAAFVRLAGTALVVAGAIGGAGWLWATYRQQVLVDDAGDITSSMIVEQADEGGMASPPATFFETFDVSLVERIDMVAGGLGLAVIAVLAAATGLGLRLAADYTVARTGGSLTGYQPGDQV